MLVCEWHYSEPRGTYMDILCDFCWFVSVHSNDAPNGRRRKGLTRSEPRESLQLKEHGWHDWCIPCVPVYIYVKRMKIIKLSKKLQFLFPCFLIFLLSNINFYQKKYMLFYFNQLLKRKTSRMMSWLVWYFSFRSFSILNLPLIY